MGVWPLRRNGTMAVYVAAVCSLTWPAVAQRDEAVKHASPVLVYEHSAPSTWLVDAKDAGLRRALAMLPARLRELPREIPDGDEIPAPVIELLISALAQPVRLAVTYDDGAFDEGAYGFGVILSLGPMERAAATQMHGTASALLRQAADIDAQVSAEFPSMSEAQSPIGGIVRFGPREAPDGWRYEVHIGAPPAPDGVFAALPTPGAGVVTTARARLDLAPLSPAIERLAEEMWIPGIEEARDELLRFGLIGPDVVRYSYHEGIAAEDSFSISVSHGLRRFAAAQGISTRPLSDAEFALFPPDCTVATIGQVGIETMVSYLRDAADTDADFNQALSDIRTETGVDLIDDTLGTLGGTFAFYMSDTTGGGLASAVMVASLADRARFERARASLVGVANLHLARAVSKGYVRLREWSDAGTNLCSLVFPGLPVPIEVTFAVEGDWLVAGLSPQACIAAARQMRERGPGLRQNDAFAGALPGDSANKITGFTFIDSPRLLRDGYTYTAMLGSAVANAVRSPIDPTREPGIVVPPLNDLKRNVRPIISYSYWNGEDLVTEMRADRSALVNVTAIIGAASPAFPVAAALIGAAMGEQRR